MTLSLDQLEALRLADRLGLYHDAAAGQMGVSRQTFGRIVSRARARVAEALLEGKVLLIEPGAAVRAGSDIDGCPVHRGPRRQGRACQCRGGSHRFDRSEGPSPGGGPPPGGAR